MPALRSRPAALTVTAVLTLSLGMLAGCGGGDGGTTEPPTAPGPVLDFSPIAGEWTGSGTENNGFVFYMDATIASSAPRGEKIGDIIYRLEPDGPADCTGRWLAEEADDPTFVVLERIGGNCPPGTVSLTRTGDGELRYAYTPENGNTDIAATGTLTRS